MGHNFSLCWACAKIGCSLDEHAQNLFAHWMSMHKNWLLVGWACAKIGYSLAEHSPKSFRSTTCIFRVPLSPLSSFPPSPSPIPVYVPYLTYLPCLPSYCMSPFLCLCSLSHILCPLSYVSVPNCLPSSVPCLTSLFLTVSRPLYSVSRDMSPVSHPPFSVP